MWSPLNLIKCVNLLKINRHSQNATCMESNYSRYLPLSLSHFAVLHTTASPKQFVPSAPQLAYLIGDMDNAKKAILDLLRVHWAVLRVFVLNIKHICRSDLLWRKY